MALKKSDIKKPVLPKEAVQVDELGGEVIVRGLLLRQRLELFGNKQAEARIGQMLAATVIDAEGLPVFTADEWEEFGAVHFDACLKLFTVAQRLSGMALEVERKN